jgi:transcriptional regulator with XRE-family HTH domain
LTVIVRPVYKTGMHLSDYMNKRKLDDAAVADAINVTRVTISRIRRRKVRPDWGTIDKLKSWSKGAITADDFQQLESAQ